MAIQNPIDPELKTKWLDALKSGDYKKGKGSLSTGDTYCCLGVLCDLLNPSGWSRAENCEKDVIRAFGLSPQEGYTGYALMPGPAANMAGLTYSTENYLAGINDQSDTFEPIIAWIEANL